MDVKTAFKCQTLHSDIKHSTELTGRKMHFEWKDTLKKEAVVT